MKPKLPVVIRTPYPTATEVAKDLGITPQEEKQLDRLLLDVMQTPHAKRAMRRVFDASPAELGRAAISEATFEALVALEEKLARFSIQVCEMVDRTNLNYLAIAKRTGLRPSVVKRITSGAAYNSGLDVLARFALACGYELEFGLKQKGKKR